MSRSKPTPRLRQPYLSASTVPPGVLTFEMPYGSFAHVADERVPFEVRRQAGLEASRAARREATKLHAELAASLIDRNAVGIYSMIVIQERLSRGLAPQDMFGYDATVNYLGGLVLSLLRERVEATLGLPVTGAEVLQADDLLRQIASAEAEASVADIWITRTSTTRPRATSCSRNDNWTGWPATTRTCARSSDAPSR